MKDLEREIKTVDTTFRKYADDMSQYLTAEFEKVREERETLKHQVNNHSEILKNQTEVLKQQDDSILRLITLVEELQKITRENLQEIRSE